MPLPLVLGVDTSGPYCAAALVQGAQLLDVVCEDMARGQAESLIGILETVLARHSYAWADLDALGVGTGPGNFTGIRIAVSATRGLALGLDIPAYGINGFDQRQHTQPQGTLNTVPAPRDCFYVRHDAVQGLMTRAEAESLGPRMAPQPDTKTLVTSIAQLAAQHFPAPASAPAPFYMRAPDAAPAKDAPPVLLP